VEVRDEIRNVSNSLDMTNTVEFGMATYETNPTDRSQTVGGCRFKFVIPSCFGVRASSLNCDIFAAR
jgi:hypothetical protein